MECSRLSQRKTVLIAARLRSGSEDGWQAGWIGEVWMDHAGTVWLQRTAGTSSLGRCSSMM